MHCEDKTTYGHSQRHLPFLVAIAILVSLGLGPLNTWTAVASDVGSDVGSEVGVPESYVGHVYGSSRPPSADKPQSKLWYNDGSWWALMVHAGGTQVTVHELMPDHTWRNTNAVVDTRSDNTGDALWSSRDRLLYVVSRAPGSGHQVNALAYEPAGRSWVVQPGFPVTIPTGGSSESATVDQDSLGNLWITYARGSRVWVSHSTNDSKTQWTPGFPPVVPDTTIGSDDISALIAFGASVGVLYSDQQSGGFHFAIHNDADPDDVWRSEDINSMPNMADDHINLKQLVGDPQGRIYAAIKTSAGDLPDASGSDPLVGVLTRTPDATGTGSWAFAPAGTVADDHTRPMIVIDKTNQDLYFFSTAPVSGGDIFYKKTPLANVDFRDQPGRGRPFIDVTPLVNNVSGAKDPVTAESGLVVIAVAHGKKRYVHGEMRLVGSTPPAAPPTVTATTPAAAATDIPVTSSVTSTFSEPVQGVSPSTFTLADSAGALVHALVTAGSGSNQWILDPTADLAPATPYTATLSSGITDSEGAPLSPVTWSFTTAAASVGDGTAPIVKTRVPASDAEAVGVTTTVKATFSDAVQGVDSGTFTLTETTSPGTGIAAIVSRSGTTNTWILDPASDLRPDTRYTVTLTGGLTAIRDVRGTPLATTSWQFLTGPAPKVSTKTPAADATGVSLLTKVTAKFSEKVMNVTSTTFTLSDSGGRPITALLSQDTTGRTWTLTPVVLAPSTEYTVRLTGGAAGITDPAGNALATTTWSFTTGP